MDKHEEHIKTQHMCGSVYIGHLRSMFTYVLKNVLLLGGLGTATLPTSFVVSLSLCHSGTTKDKLLTNEL